MNYELFEKLKSNGFIGHETERNNYPNLSELIEACGECFRMLLLHTTYKKKLNEPWEAVPNKKLRPDVKGQKGKTPEEAIAKLWLALRLKL